MYGRSHDRDWDDDRERRRNDMNSYDNHRYNERGRDRETGHSYGAQTGDGRRDWTDRAGDEVRSWFGDDEAERRRRMDEQRSERREDRNVGSFDRFGWGTNRGLDGGYAHERYGHERHEGRQDYNRPWADPDRRGAEQGHGRESYDRWNSGEHRNLPQYGNQSGSFNQANRSGGFYGQGDPRNNRDYDARGNRHDNSYNMNAGYNRDNDWSRERRDGNWEMERRREMDRNRWGDRHDGNERGVFQKMGDEVASWFGSDEAERRRQMDARRHQNDYDYRETFRHDDRDRDRDRTWR